MLSPINIEEKSTPASLVCPKCKKETGKTIEFILSIFINKDLLCPSCNEIVFSCKPEIRTFSYTYTNYSSGYEYD